MATQKKTQTSKAKPATKRTTTSRKPAAAAKPQAKASIDDTKKVSPSTEENTLIPKAQTSAPTGPKADEAKDAAKDTDQPSAVQAAVDSPAAVQVAEKDDPVQDVLATVEARQVQKDIIAEGQDVDLPGGTLPTSVPDRAPDARHPENLISDTLETRGVEARKQALVTTDDPAPLGADPEIVASLRKEAVEAPENVVDAGAALEHQNDNLPDEVSKSDQKKLAEAEKRVTGTEQLEPVDSSSDFDVKTDVSDKGYAYGTSNYFSVGASERYGLPIVALATRNHVGPAPLVVPLDTLEELVALLSAVVKEAKKTR